MKNTISLRIADFLKSYPPFDVLTKEQLYSISENIKVNYVTKNKVIFKENDDVNDCFYVVKDGAIGVFRDQKILVDQCDEGDIFGLRALIRKDKYLLSAISIEESIVYAIPAIFLEEIINTNPQVGKFLLTSFATNTRNPYADDDKGYLYKEHPDTNDKYAFLNSRSANYTKNPIQCSIDITIKEAAQIMSTQNIGSIIITKNSKPIGIITDRDLRDKAATGQVTVSENVSAIMSSPVKTFSPDITISEAQIAMIENSITHLCITEDGTPDSSLIGILSEHDIIVLHGNDPSVLIKEIKRASDADSLKTIRIKANSLLKTYIEQQVPIAFISKVISSINSSLTRRAIELSLQEVGDKIPVNFSWLALGSQGRKEQLLLTDQDNALVFENVPKDQLEETRLFFVSLAKNVTSKLNHIGFEYCPADMMASNPSWCLSLDEWKAQFDDWITNPNQEKILLCTIFFDYNHVFGDKTLAEEMSKSIFNATNRYGIFLNFLGLNALKNPPPLSFFRQFLVEQSGDHKDQFDIKSRVMMPLVDAARLLILDHNIKDVNNTILRYEKLIELEPQNKDLYLFCIRAYKILLTFRTKVGFKNGNSGRYIDLHSLSKADKLELRSTFKTVKEIQELIRIRFNLAQML